MGLTYFKRFRMEIGLSASSVRQSELPPGYRFESWRPGLLEVHADTKYRSFRTEVDAHVFPCLGEVQGCLRLMEEITQKDGFLPGATWLVAYQPNGVAEPDYCGTIQGVQDRGRMGSVQNVGITPEHRGRGVGMCLLQRALCGFREAGMRRVYLEVTAENTRAIRLYQRLGFRRVRTVYKAVEVAYS